MADARASGRILAPETVARLARLRLTLRHRVEGRFVGGHPARGFGSSQDFADYRDYTPGDDPRFLDLAAYTRLGRRLVRLYTAEDTAALRVAVDGSASMGFGGKWPTACGAAAALVALAAAGGDRVRVLVAGERVDPGPWYAGPTALVAAEARLSAASPAPAGADLAAALRRARGEGPRGPVVLVSDLLLPEWEDLLGVLGGYRSDALLVHLLGREDLEPAIAGDIRLIDAETGAEVEVSASRAALERYTAARDDWLDGVQRRCASRGVTYTRLLDDQSVERWVVGDLSRLGVVA